MYNNVINSCIEDLKTEILSFMPVSVANCQWVNEGFQTGFNRNIKDIFNCLQTWEVSPFTPMKRHLLAGYSHAVGQSVITDY